MPNVAIVFLRLIFVLVAVGLGVGLINSTVLPNEPAWIPWVAIAACLIGAAVVIGLDIPAKPKRLETMTAVYFGLIVGMFLTYIVRLAMTPLLPNPNHQIVHWVELGTGAVLCYLTISILMQTKDDFR